MACEFKTYPSGFLGSAIVAQTTKNDLLRLKTQIFNNPTHPIAKETANLQVCKLWKNAVETNDVAKTFEYKSDVIKAALAAFGCTTLGEWVKAQRNAPGYGSFHEQWIVETVEYVMFQLCRKMGFQFWIRMLDQNVIDEKTTLSEPIERYFHTGGQYADLPITAFVHEWVKQPTGMDDLIQSLNVLFGKR
jgi:hypothetical protein